MLAGTLLRSAASRQHSLERQAVEEVTRVHQARNRPHLQQESSCCRQPLWL